MATTITPGRTTAVLAGESDDDLVVFLIGARLNRVRALPRMIRIGRQMTAMQAELRAQPELGCLAIENYGGRTSLSLQYWRSFEHLEAYARSAGQAHLPAWKEFNRLARGNADIGIWHETHVVRAHESMYVNMPRFGLAAAGSQVPVGAQSTARDRVGSGAAGSA